MNFPQPRNSKLKLLSIKYLKVITEDEEYFFLEKIYVSGWDANIKLTKISEEVFKDAYYNNKLIEILELENAKPHIKYNIKKLKGEV